jgi:UDP-N-acetylmuramyl pentapeptide phosphotransferase/UDP-N-acetylglucosamine-1-phosphate transferase
VIVLTSMLLAAAVAAVLAGVLTPVLVAWAHRRELLDVPNDRSSHVVATPRIGGVALVYGVLAGVVVLHVAGAAMGDEVTIVLAGAVAIAFLGLLDDFRDLPALVRLAVHAAVSIAVVMSAGAATLPWIGGDGWAASVLTVFWLVTLTNAYNFMDGIDGIAGAQALVAGIGWAAVGLLVGAPECTALGLVLAAASAGFLLYNWHPAKVFMGDAGSGFFGFLFGALPLIAAPGSAALWWCAVLLMWPFLLDASFTLVRRARLGENILAAHRSHVYQRLLITGRSHRYVTLVYAGLALLGAVAAVLLAAGHRPAMIVAVATILGTALAVWRNVKAREAASRRLTDHATA